MSGLSMLGGGGSGGGGGLGGLGGSSSATSSASTNVVGVTNVKVGGGSTVLVIGLVLVAILWIMKGKRGK